MTTLENPNATTKPKAKPGCAATHGSAWASQPNKSGWWWWHHPEQAPLGIVVLVHDDNESLTEYWWAYLPKRINPQRIWELPKGGSWCGPIAKPQMPNVRTLRPEQERKGYGKH